MTPRLPTRCTLLLVAPLLLLPLAAAGQSLPIKTVPIPHGEQFLLFPSANLGAGDLHIAADDPLLDPFINPALGARVEGAWFSTQPTFYGSNDNMVGGRSLPLTVVGAGRHWFGTVTVAMQQVEDPSRDRWGWIPVPVPEDRVLLGEEPSNSYLHASLGRRLSRSTALGASVSYADLGSMDGVNRLYARSVGIEQVGELSEVKVGLLHELSGERTLEVTASRSLLDMTHHVYYADWGWDPMPNPQPWFRQWEEENRDRTETWGTRVRFTAPLSDRNTRVGAVLAANTKDHPKIPNYEVVNIPRDPGNSTIFALGAGVQRREGGTTFGAEVLFAPGRSHTWAFADTTVELPSGAHLQPGDKTVDNRFRYANWSMAVGLDHTWDDFGAQLGLALQNYAYRLEQKNFLRETERTTREGWMEWSPSWGAHYALGRFELRYAGRFVAKGSPDFRFWPGEDRAVTVAMPEGDFVVAPTDPVNMPDFRVTTHRISVSVPLTSGKHR